MAGTAPIGTPFRHVTAETGTAGISVMKGHEAALRVQTTPFSLMAACRTARCIRRLLILRIIVTDGTARLMMADHTADLTMGLMIEHHGKLWRIFYFKHDRFLRIFHFAFKVRRSLHDFMATQRKQK